MSTLRQLCEVQNLAHVQRAMPPVSAVAEGFWVVPQPYPDAYMRYSYCYVYEGRDGSLHVIDPGWDSQQNWLRLRAQLAVLQRSVDEIRTVSMTHFHPDHAGMAMRIRRHSGAAVQLSRADALAAHQPGDAADFSARYDRWGVPGDRRAELIAVNRQNSEHGMAEFTVDKFLLDGDALEIPGRDIRVVATPGHSPGHVCFRDVDTRAVLTGDHVLPVRRPVVGARSLDGRSPLVGYLESLDRIAQLPENVGLPGHEHAFTDLGVRCEAIADYHRHRLALVSAIHATKALTVWETAEHLPWRSGFASLIGFRLYVGLALTDMHMHAVDAVDHRAE